MSLHEVFHYKSLEELLSAVSQLGVDMACSTDLSIFASPMPVGRKSAPNRFAILPMEGCDSRPDGGPSDLVVRRYRRFFSGGAGLVWWEANAVVQEGRANELQMMLTDANAAEFAVLLKDCRQAALERNGAAPVSVLQLTHSGRYSRPVGHVPAPIVPQRDPILDARSGVDSDLQVCSDEYLESLIPRYVHSAILAKEVGFDGIDVKACHRYLLSELLASHTRTGRFGGSYENRSRLMLSIIREIRKACGDDFIIASRFNVFDAHPYPYGFGEDEHDMWRFDPTEPVRLVRDMVAAGVDLLSNSAGNPYYIYPQVTRPFDVSSQGIPVPQEHPLESIARLFAFTRTVQDAAGDIPVVGNGYTWLRNFIPYVGAANLEAHGCSFVGLGRSAIAYPDAPRDILSGAGMDPKKCCVTCSRCTQIMRDHGRTGCVIRDAGTYGPLYRQYREAADARAQGGKS
ncbi:MAG: NADH:flavin oxidoreductase [Sphaerochaetaceae bacterium]|nr:NADH:flavin oxidoreductase [Sphaerochaetaceae bacterium]